MTMRFLMCAILAAVIPAVFATSSPAQITFLTSQDQATFTATLDASPVPFTNPFSINPFLPPPPDLFNFTGPSPSNHFAYDISVPVGGLYASGEIFGALRDGVDITITPTADNFNALGGNFFATNEFDQFLSVPITITATNSFAESFNITYTPTSENQFLSIYSPNSPITSIVFSAPGVLDSNIYNSFDNIVVGVSPVPEPSLLIAGVAGLALVVGRVRRRFEPVLAA